MLGGILSVCVLSHEHAFGQTFCLAIFIEQTFCLLGWEMS
jgi:hypothetical protein